MPSDEIILDAVTGLPEVRATRSPDGQLTFRLHTVRSGGMSVFIPISDGVLRSVRATPGHVDDDDWETRVRGIALAVAASLRTAEAQRQARVEDLEGQLGAMGESLDAERRRADDLERRLAEETQDRKLPASKAPARRTAASA